MIEFTNKMSSTDIRMMKRHEQEGKKWIIGLSGTNIHVYEEIEGDVSQPIKDFNFSAAGHGPYSIYLSKISTIKKEGQNSFIICVLINFNIWILEYDTVSQVFGIANPYFYPYGSQTKEARVYAMAISKMDRKLFFCIKHRHLEMFNDWVELDTKILTGAIDKIHFNSGIATFENFVIVDGILGFYLFEVENDSLIEIEIFGELSWGARTILAEGEIFETGQYYFFRVEQKMNRFEVLSFNSLSKKISRVGFSLLLKKFNEDLIVGKIEKHKYWISNYFCLFEIDIQKKEVGRFVKKDLQKLFVKKK